MRMHDKRNRGRLHMALTALLSLAATGAAVAGKYNAVIDIGDPMPAFEALPAIDGTTLSAQDLTEEVIVLVSLANHCPWVRGMDPGLVELVAYLGDHNVRVIGFSVNHREDDRLAAMRAHAERYRYNFTYVYDESQALGRSLGATRTPEYFVFGADRKLAYMGLLYNSPAKMSSDGSIRYTRGEPTEFYVRDAVHAALAGRSVQVAETKAHGCSVTYE